MTQKEKEKKEEKRADDVSIDPISITCVCWKITGNNSTMERRKKERKKERKRERKTKKTCDNCRT